MALRFFEIFKVYNYKKDRVKPFKKNEIHTSKYNIITFLPKNLFYQFSKMSNTFFLIMSLLEVSTFIVNICVDHQAHIGLRGYPRDACAPELCDPGVDGEGHLRGPEEALERQPGE